MNGKKVDTDPDIVPDDSATSFELNIESDIFCHMSMMPLPGESVPDGVFYWIKWLHRYLVLSIYTRYDGRLQCFLYFANCS